MDVTTRNNRQLFDTVRAHLAGYYDEPWLSERAANVTMALWEPDVGLPDVAHMLSASGQRPAADVSGEIIDQWRGQLMLAGGIFATAWRWNRRRTIMEAL